MAAGRVLALILFALFASAAPAQNPDSTPDEVPDVSADDTSDTSRIRRLTIIRKYTARTDDKVVPAKAAVDPEPAPASLPFSILGRGGKGEGEKTISPAQHVEIEPPAPQPASDEVHEEFIVERAESPERLWFSASHLLWWIKAFDVPPLVTTGPTSEMRPGALDSIFTSIRFGGDDNEPHERHGARVFMGYWLDAEQRSAVELGGFFLANRSISFIQSSPGAPVIARPFYDVLNDEQSASIVTYPGIALGGVSVRASTALHGVESNFTYVMRDDGLLGFDVLAGFRYVDLEEDVRIQESSQVLVQNDPKNNPPFAGQTITVRDEFKTENDFFGGQIGVRARYHLRRLEVRVSGKVAFGDSYEVVRIAGSTNFSNGSAKNGGLLALPSNSGQFSRHTFAFIPEANAEFSYQLFKRLRLFAGYSFLYWSNVVRPGDQIDLAVNTNQLPTNIAPGVGGPGRPRFDFRDTDFWVQGANFGVEFRY